MAGACCAPAIAAADPRVTREVFLKSPKEGTAVMAAAWYTSAKGTSLLSVETRYSRSDTVDVAYYRTSRDNGRTWSRPTQHKTAERRPEGMLRRHPRTGINEPTTGKFIEFFVQGVLPTDDPLEGMRRWNIFYRVDGKEYQAIQHGQEFGPDHPFPGVHAGRSMVMLGDVSSVPLILKNGTILLPAITTPLTPEGKPYNPTGGYTYTDAIILHARWQNGRLAWTSSGPVKGDPARSTRGMDEPTLAQLHDGRLMMILRGSNDRNPALPAYKWVCFSTDGGFHWSEPKPWTYTSGEAFFSPSASSQLVPHSNGKLYWLGHISATNARGNRPRYPVYVGEVDQTSGLLLRDSLIQIDDRQPDDDEILMLYSLCAREEREDHRINLHMSRLFAFPNAWRGDALLYRIRV